MNNFKNESAARHGVRAAGLLMALVLTACGGGGGNPGAVGGSSGNGTGTDTGSGSGGGTTVPAAPTVTLGLTNAAGASVNALTSATPLTVKATVLDAAKKPVPNAIVAFATDNALAVFLPSAGTALTDVNGVATITMRAASLDAGGAGTVTATSNVAGTTVSGTSNYAVGATTLAFDTLSASPASLQAYGTTTLSVKVLAGSSAYTDQPVNVTFGSNCVDKGLATMTATVPTNTTTGIAQTTYRDKGCGGNDTITVSAAGVAKQATTALTIAPPGAASVQFVGASPTTQSIVIKGQGGNGRTETATLTFKVVDIFGNPLAGKQVNFTTSAPSITVNKASDTTDAAGQVITTVNSGDVPTSFRVQATLPGTGTNGGPDISTLSDSIVVTTGLPVQRAFSLSSGSFNVEGWSVDDPSATTVQVMLADAFGNPVPDGTPVVFQTNMGAIGSSDKGGCNTVNGICSVVFRTQAPRVATPGVPATPCNAVSPDATRPGLATICASSTDGTNTVYARTAIFMSGGTVAYAYLDGSTTPISGGTIDLGTIKSSETRTFTLQLDDVNQNPLPAGTKVEITNMLNGNAAPVVPATVPSVAPHSAGSVDDPTGTTVGGNPQGYTHFFSVSSTTPTNCTGPAQASFNVTVTSPAGSVTSIPFKLSFTCP